MVGRFGFSGRLGLWYLEVKCNDLKIARVQWYLWARFPREGSGVLKFRWREIFLAGGPTVQKINFKIINLILNFKFKYNILSHLSFLTLFKFQNIIYFSKQNIFLTLISFPAIFFFLRLSFL